MQSSKQISVAAILSCLLTFFAGCSPCAPLVAGHVRDATTGAGVEGVLVVLYEDNVRIDSSLTDSTGIYATSIPSRSQLLEDCTPDVRVVCSKEGYDTAAVEGRAPDIGLDVLMVKR